MFFKKRFNGFFCFLNWFFKAFSSRLVELEGKIWTVLKKGKGPYPLDLPRCVCFKMQIMENFNIALKYFLIIDFRLYTFGYKLGTYCELLKISNKERFEY